MTPKGTTRRALLQGSAGLAPIAAAASFGVARARSTGRRADAVSGSALQPLTPPASGKIPVAFPISRGAVLIDFAGPWEVFLNASFIGADGNMDMEAKGGFQLYTVAETRDVIEVGGGMKIAPNYTFENAPAPKLIVIPAQAGDSEPMLRWIRQAARDADMTMSVCTGAFVLAKTGLLSGKAATTHHGAYSQLAMDYPDIRVKRGYRFVDEGNIASSGGLTCGVDLAFHVVERYHGRKVAAGTAFAMEYQGRGWMDATGADNAIYAMKASGPACAVCGMAVDRKTCPTSTYKGRRYVFCSAEHQALFAKNPEAVLRAAA